MSSIENIKNISELFKTTRKFNGLVQLEFANKLGVRQGTVSKVESGIMVPDIGLWFKLLKAFKILDPYCFTYIGLEYSKEVFDLLLSEGSRLAPKFNFCPENVITEIRSLRPLFDYLIVNEPKIINKFLTKEKVEKEIFYILNHPIGIDFIDAFFSYFDDGKINAKSLALISFNFEASYGKNFDQLKTASDFITQLSNEKRESDLFQIEKSKNENEYFISITKGNFQKIKDAKSLKKILEYNILLPFHALRSIKGVGQTPKIAEMKDKFKWQVQYAIS